jgi:hypothetical protein
MFATLPHCADSPGGYQLIGRTLPIWNTWGRTGPFTPEKPWLLEFFDQVRHIEPAQQMKRHLHYEPMSQMRLLVAGPGHHRSGSSRSARRSSSPCAASSRTANGVHRLVSNIKHVHLRARHVHAGMTFTMTFNCDTVVLAQL